MKFVVVVIFIALALTIGVPMTAHSANITHSDSQIILEGKIKNEDYKELQRVVDRTGIKSIRFNSDGGAAIEGYQIGYTIRKNKMSTVIKKGDRCLSACAVAYLGGTNKYNYGILGFHVAWAQQSERDFNEGMRAGQLFGSIDSIYSFNMGYTAQLNFIISQITSKKDFLVLSLDDLKLFEMKDREYTDFQELPKNWMSDRLYNPLRLHLLTGGR
jgi:hypothetical protein|tara:strand:+ start:638 stop:1282 length:645 start_codon:yes stop_codon:yes gene_type:complete